MSGTTRRQFLRSAAVTAGMAGWALDRPAAFAQKRELTFLSWNHFVPAADVESEPLVLTSASEPDVEETKEAYRPSARGTRFYTVSAFAAMPHAGLTQQAP